MSNPDNCPSCDNIYGNEPRKIPCGHIVCLKCCLELFNKEDNTLKKKDLPSNTFCDDEIAQFDGNISLPEQHFY
ncbi:unnamed protein product [Adineta steineri]|uniref:RING-type domain-containing protein n=1 Tax=Adineta steineri TaxID=433720 RepID=A0A815PRI5_9BILA|nr:unnamed protein product [Adineta steineri]CAF3869544.1 unnamed protein product [Adineta steineri]